jgi:hypothetical protein
VKVRWAERGTGVALIERVESFPCIAEKPKQTQPSAHTAQAGTAAQSAAAVL